MTSGSPNPAPGILDLGAIDAPVLFFGGPYSNRQATEALFADAAELGIPPERMICTGDVVAYAADPAPCVKVLMDAGCPVVMGNCEESLGFDEDDCGCGFAEDIARWLFRSSPASDKREEIERIETVGPVDLIVAGHCGLPFMDDLGDKFWINAGVIGMPANDGTSRTWCAVVEPRDGGVAIDIRPLDYDHEGAARRMRDEGLAEAYAKTLTDGFWPNMDVLPEAERKMRGRPLAPQRLAWSPETAAAAE